MVALCGLAACQLASLSPRHEANAENTPPDSIEVAEAEATTYPSSTPPDPLPAIFAEEDRVGTADRKCVETNDNSEARSGEFIAGSFKDYPASWREGHGKMWWVPLHTPGSNWYPSYINSLVIRATRLDQSGENTTFSSSALAWTEGPSRATFFPTDIHLPTEGLWMLVATAGPDWGCFILDLE